MVEAVAEGDRRSLNKKTPTQSNIAMRWRVSMRRLKW
jgi:hypothetical protein